MTSPAPSEGETPRDDQSESTSRPVPDDAPPVRTKRTPVTIGLLVLLWLALGVALVVLAISALG